MTIDNTLAERQKTHGDFKDHASITQELKLLLHQHRTWVTLTPSMQEALDMIAHKIGRVLAGNPEHLDHWHDIAGYATLVHRQIDMKTPKPPASYAKKASVL